MSLPHAIPKRFVGLDVHKHYLIATAVDIDLNILFGPQRVQLSGLEAWIAKTLTKEDDLVLEMTTNSWVI
jgi:hypothetical protein